MHGELSSYLLPDFAAIQLLPINSLQRGGSDSIIHHIESKRISHKKNIDARCKKSQQYLIQQWAAESM
jgi:hypothetical protein